MTNKLEKVLTPSIKNECPAALFCLKLFVLCPNKNNICVLPPAPQIYLYYSLLHYHFIFGNCKENIVSSCFGSNDFLKLVDNGFKLQIYNGQSLIFNING